MSASDTLRRAAKALREHAEAAEKTTPGRWTVEQDDDAWELYAGRGEYHGFKLAKCMKRHQRYMEYWPPEAHSAHIALMDPTVGLALADWLDTAGADWWAHGGPHCDGGCMECDDDLVGPHLRRAMAVARAILREPETDT